MNWPDLSMGGYGFYVWGSYLFALVLIVWEVVSLRQRKKALANEAQKAVTNDDRPAAVRTTVLRGSTNETTS
jgi:heme exporter protein D